MFVQVGFVQSPGSVRRVRNKLDLISSRSGGNPFNFKVSVSNGQVQRELSPISLKRQLFP